MDLHPAASPRSDVEAAALSAAAPAGPRITDEPVGVDASSAAPAAGFGNSGPARPPPADQRPSGLPSDGAVSPSLS